MIFGSPWNAILWNRSHYLILWSMKKKLCQFWPLGATCPNTKSRHVEFYDSLILKLIYILEALDMPFCGIGVIIRSCVGWSRNCDFFWPIGVTCTNTKSRHVEFYDSLILKLIWCFGGPWCAILRNRSHYSILCRMK